MTKSFLFLKLDVNLLICQLHILCKLVLMIIIRMIFSFKRIFSGLLNGQLIDSYEIILLILNIQIVFQLINLKLFLRIFTFLLNIQDC
jgi:hypothetical protein